MKPVARYLALAAIATAFLAAPPAMAKPRSINDCEKIKDGDAYNRCLASFGPKRGASRSGKAYRAPKGASRNSGRKYGRTRVRSGSVSGIRIYRSGGRVRTVIPMGKRKR
jgi:hypothetical protein